MEDECLLLEREEKEEARRLELIEQFTDFTQRMKMNMSTLSFEERKQVVRLLVEEVIVNTKIEEATVRHIMPLDQQFPLCTGGRTSSPRFRPCGIDCGEVSSQGQRVSVADLEDISYQSYKADCRHRLFHRSDTDLPQLVLFHNPAA